jgi:CO/xanthine dehydrogenase FAD-binding subunit
MLPEFELYEPESLDEALKILDQTEAVPISGGTNMVVDLRSGRHSPPAIMDIHGLQELRGILEINGLVVVGGGVTIAELEKSPIITKHAHILWEAARSFANPLIRNRATIGGNLADASPAADTATPLLALGASLVLSNAGGSRVVPLDEFFVHVRKTTLQPNELITSLSWQIPPAASVGVYYKLGLRKADAISVVSLAVVLEADGDAIGRVRIALGSVAPKPIRVKTAEDVLKDRKLDDELIKKAARLAAETVFPITDVRASASYRYEMVETLTSRLLRQASSQLWK